MTINLQMWSSICLGALTVRSLLAIAAARHWSLCQMDVKNAFPNGDLTKEVYMQPPPSSLVPSTKTERGVLLLLLLYVNDMIITEDDIMGISSLKKFLSRQFEMKDLGLLSNFLGLEISYDSSGYFLTQAKYTSDLLVRAALTNCKTTPTPIDPQTRLTPLDLLSDGTIYRQLAGNLIYLTIIRLDISDVVHIVSQFMAAPRSLHYDALIRILYYLKGTMFHGLHYSAYSSIQLHTFSDADWVGDPIDRRSTIGLCFFLGDCLISWRSKTQTLVARSSTEAKYRAFADTT
ncbi:uncharacterized protein LOC114295371 [Camellia sinensis]|uniref:uncharacterized protein LOC114295371 n=1 Tax=Camellia sinensis TaxID=4442 RepID=UPI001036B35E|nr:uncharacterized protein LOC114295371 [Camellia sinensis]